MIEDDAGTCPACGAKLQWEMSTRTEVHSALGSVRIVIGSAVKTPKNIGRRR
jgi:hypothetical protein